MENLQFENEIPENIKIFFQNLKRNPEYPSHLSYVRSSEFQIAKGATYVDHAASTQYGRAQMKNCFHLLKSNFYSNPHSRNLPSDITTEAVESVRNRILDHFNTSSDEYCVIFTAGSTDSIKLISNYFKWSRGIEQNFRSAFVYTQENHTSILGLRECAHSKGAKVYCIPCDKVEDCFVSKNKLINCPENSCNSFSKEGRFDIVKQDSIGLFAYPALCNFSGTKYPLSWIKKIQENDFNLSDQYCINQFNLEESEPTVVPRRWFVLLDASSYCSTSHLDLSLYKPDFVPISFYKMFGFPSGLGCLLVHKRAQDVLVKNYFGGGTVLMVDSRRMDVKYRRDYHEKFEDGTLPFLNILCLAEGFSSLNRLTGGMRNVESHVFNLAKYFILNLGSWRHSSGSPVAEIYCEHLENLSMENHGGIVNFNLLHPNGEYYGYSQVEKMASIYNIYLRTGCMCNPGACQRHLGITSEKLQKQYESGHVCGDSTDLVDGSPTGSVRVSFGYMSDFEDADRILRMIRECFVSGNLEIDLDWIASHDPSLDSKVKEPISDLKSKNSNDAILDPERKCLTGHESKISEFQSSTDVSGDPKIENSKNNIDALAQTQNSKNTISEAEEMCPEFLEEKYSKPTEILDVTNKSYNDKEIGNSDNSYPEQNIKNHLETKISSLNLSKRALILDSIYLYPIKSCAGIRVDRWSMDDLGLEFDRRWMILTTTGVTLTQKRKPELSLLKPIIDLQRGLLILSYPGVTPIEVSLHEPAESTAVSSSVCGGRICGERVNGNCCGAAVSRWLSAALKTEGLRLIRQSGTRKCKLGAREPGNEPALMSLSNESQFLVVHRPSVKALQENMRTRAVSNPISEEELIIRFRPNFVLDGGFPYEEDNWKRLSIGHHSFLVLAGCSRCQMICVNPETGEKSKEPLLALSETRGLSMKFGVYAVLDQRNEEHLTMEHLSADQQRQVHSGMLVHSHSL